MSACLEVLLAGALMITALIVAAPLHPSMPTSGLDPSWGYAISQAGGERLAFGRELIFTFGPYGAILTRAFHPDVDSLAMGVGMFFGVCFGTVLILLARQSLWWGLCLLFVVGGQMYQREILFASYGLFLSVAIGNAIWATVTNQRHFSRVEIGLFVVLLFVLGLLPLIKGSLIANSVATVIAAFLLFLAAGLPFLAVASVATPVVGAVAFWILAGQAVADLPSYFTNMLQIISGYTEAMAVDGDFSEVVVIIAASAAILYVLFMTPTRFVFKTPLLVAFGAFLFLAFKGGFVRHDGHATYAAAAVLVASIAIKTSVPKPGKGAALLWLGVVAWLAIERGYVRSLSDILWFNLPMTYAEGFEGFRQRVLKTVDLNQVYLNQLTTVAQEVSIPKLDGTTDIYSYNQAHLLASGNSWRPRPVLQSYSAYTAYLAQLDRDYLDSEEAANNIVFRLETIDNRYPAMDDGASWPILLTKYSLYDEQNDYLLLKRVEGAAEPRLHQVLAGTFKLGQTVDLPIGDLLYAEIDLHPSLVGRLALSFYKTRPLRMSVILANGQTRYFRIVSGMAGAGFLLSPFVENTAQVASLFGALEDLKENQIRAIRIDGNSLFWNSEFHVKISAVDPVAPRLARVPTLEDGPPHGLTVAEVETCEGYVDRVNGVAPLPRIKVTNFVSVDGWMTILGKDGTTPDNVYLTLGTEDGRTIYVNALRLPRLDVNASFGVQKMRNAGFKATINTSSLAGNMTLGLARKVNERIELCKNFEWSLYRGEARTATSGQQP